MAEILFPNIASNAAVRDVINTDLIPLVKRVRSDRQVLRNTWLRYSRIWGAERDMQAYNGRSKTYIATGRRVIENWVQKLKADLFPTDEWYDVIALREAFEDRRPALKALFRYYLTKHMRLRRKMTPFLRQLVTLGTSPVSMIWRLDERTLSTMQAILDPDGNPTKRAKMAEEVVTSYIGPTFRVCDLFAWYIYPYTITDVGDASLIFEDQLIDRRRLMALSQAPIATSQPGLGMQIENLGEALDLNPDASNETKDKFDAERQRLQAKGFTARLDDVDPGRPIDITTCYWRIELNGVTDWYRVIIGCDRIPLKVQRNPFMHGEPPWLAGKFVEVQNEFYGRGLPEQFDRLQYFLNDVADQANDALVWSMNPIAVVDAYKVQVPESIRMRPGAKWLAEKDGITFAEPPKDTPAIGFQAVGQLISLMNDVGNVSAFAGSGIAGPARRGRAVQTATGAQIIQGEALIQVRDVVENIEDQVMIPGLRMMHSLTLQCLSRPLLLRIAGADGAGFFEQKITVEDIVGDFDFQWLGSTNAANRDVRAQQMINFLQIAARIPPQLLAQNNVQIDFGYLMRALWSDGLGLRNSERVLKDIQRMRSMDPRVENDLFRVGRGDEVHVSMGDNDEEHYVVHSRLFGDPSLDPEIARQVSQHNQEHLTSYVTKQAMQLQAQQQQQQQQLLGPQAMNGAGPGQPGQPPPNGGNGALPPPPDNPGRMAQTMTPGDVMRGMPRGMT